MTRRSTNSRGAALVQRLHRGRQQADRAARPGARRLPTLHGLTQQSLFTMPMENVLTEAREILLASERVYCYGNMVAMECGEGAEKHLSPLMIDQRIESGAPHRKCERLALKSAQFPLSFPFLTDGVLSG